MKSEIIEKQSAYRIKLPNFEGPLDLLLYLIKKEEMDIYDIPIATITKQYLDYVELMKELDLEVAGEFILMAATLIQIKVKMLLPRSPLDDEEEEEDPRAELVRQLLEYRRFKEVAESLDEIEERQRRQFPRSYFDWQKPFRKKEVVLKDMTLFELISAFKTVLDNLPKDSYHQVGALHITVEEQIDFLMKLFQNKERIAFGDLISQLKERLIIIVTFMALLELIRTHQIFVQQVSVFDEIWIVKR